MNTYLDGCLAEPATKALLVQSRTEAGLSDLVAARNASAAALLPPELVTRYRSCKFNLPHPFVGPVHSSNGDCELSGKA